MTNYAGKIAKGFLALPIAFAVGCGEAPKPEMHTRNGVTKIERHNRWEPCYFDTDDKISRIEYCGDERFTHALVVSLPDTNAQRSIAIILKNHAEMGNRNLDFDNYDRQFVRKDYFPHGQELERRFNELRSRYNAPVPATEK